jgi:hypothetical protein
MMVMVAAVVVRMRCVGVVIVRAMVTVVIMIAVGRVIVVVIVVVLIMTMRAHCRRIDAPIVIAGFARRHASSVDSATGSATCSSIPASIALMCWSAAA